MPYDFDSTKTYPMVLFLHGKGERGSDNISQLKWGSALFLQGGLRRRFPAIIVFPQCPEKSYWSNVLRGPDKSGKDTFHFIPNGDPTLAMSLVMDLERELKKTLPVDTSRLYVMGLSMGGMGSFEIVRRMPGTFAAAVPICGGADTTTAKAIRKTAFWIFHGSADDVVPVKYSQDMVTALQSYYNTADMQYSEFTGVKHDSWNNAFADPDLLPWLFSQRLSKPK
jgi:predicted peptidase